METNNLQITPQDEQDILRRLRDTPLQTMEDLDNYLRVFYGVYLAKVPIEEGNSTPLRFVWEIYNTAMEAKEKDVYNFLGVASRGGQKSLACGVLEALLLTHDKYRDYFHMASVTQQSKVTYNYVQSFFRKPLLAETIDKCIMSETKTRYGRQLIIGTGTMNSVNSFHGCISGDAIVTTENGDMELRELFKNRTKNKTIKSINGKLRAFTNIVCTGKKDVYEIELENGYKVKATKEHVFPVYDVKFMIWEDSGLKKIKVGDYLFVTLDEENSMIKSPVKSIQKQNKTIDVYDIEMKDSSCPYWVANDIVVHNSVIQDEVDLTPPTVFKESKGMLTAQKGKMALNVCISSRKYSFGNVEDLLDKSKRQGYPLRIHKWSVLEVTQRCEDERSGKYGVNYYIDEDNLECLTTDEFYLISNPDKRNRYKMQVGYENCKECGIFSFCKGNLKKQETDNEWLQPIEQVRNLFFTDDLWFFMAQRLNRKPSTKGKVFPMWDEDTHVKSYSEMFKILTGKECEQGYDLTLEALIQVFKEYNCQAYIGVDFGFNCGIALLAFVDGSDRVYVVDEYIAKGLSDSDFAFNLKKEWGQFRSVIFNGFPDIASPQGIKEFSKYFPMIKDNKEYNKLSKIPEYRASQIRKTLKGPGSGLVRLYVSYECGNLRDEMPFYHYKIDPKTEEPTETIEKKNDHSIDALGNILTGLFGAQVTQADYAIDTPEDEAQIVNVPTVKQVADAVGVVNFTDNREKNHEEEEKEDSDDVIFDFA